VYLHDDETVNHLTVGHCTSPTDDGYYATGTTVGRATGTNNSNYGTAGPDVTLNFYVQGQTDPTSLCVAADCTGNIGGVTEDPNANLPTSGSVVIAAPFDQAVSVLGQSGITPSPADKLNFFHPGKSHFRDSHAYCGVHVLLDATSGQNGQPTTGSFHVDEFNP